MKRDFNNTYGCFYVHTKDNNKIDYTIRYIVFNPLKFFVGTDVAKDFFRKQMHTSKKKMKEEYDSIFGTWMTIGRGKNKHIEFNKSTKIGANIIFIVPKKWKSHAYHKVIENLELPFDKVIFHS